MDFASKYVYAKKRIANDAPKPQAQSSFGNSVPEPDTNVISAKFDHLVEISNTHAGEPIICSHCSAVLSKYSKLVDSDDNRKKIWSCDFCDFENKIFIEKEEVPINDETTYILETSHDIKNQQNVDSNYLIYCIDISGSMSVTTQVDGNFKLPTDQIRQETFRNVGGEHFFNSRQMVRHITRLEAVQVAIDDNLSKLEKSNPDRKVGIVTFNQNVRIIGDGKVNEIKMQKEVLENKDEIESTVERTQDFEPLINTKALLREKLLNLEEGGATALGPALYYSILLASRKSGSQVILCTDGLANKGIGSLEDENQEQTNKFYSDLGDLAQSKGVSVSIITIEGTNCKLGLLGEISNKTGGIVNVVNPLNLKKEFSTILDEPVIATKVVADLILHKALYVKDHENFDNRQSTISKQIGNVTKETEITFEFCIRDDFEIKQKQLPFQLKITYNAMNGTKLLRVLTKLKDLTDDKKLAEEHSDRKILASNIVQTQGRLMQNQQQSSNIFNLNKYSSYVTTIQPRHDDLFSPQVYNQLESELNEVRSKTTIAPCAFGSSFGQIKPQTTSVSQLDDRDASKVYSFGRLKKKDFSKKKE